MNLDSGALAIHHRLQTDLSYYADKAPLIIKDKQGAFIKWRFNIAQRWIHDRLEDQKARCGWVRALMVKGRQQGGSTYVNGRFYRDATRLPGTSVFILSHDGEATEKLFRMVETFHENIDPALRPEVGESNRRQFVFKRLRSDYSLATAGNKDAGRGSTAQRFHWSEAAYCENDYAIQNGVLQAIGLVPNTEVIIESTGNGPKGLFYDKCMWALKGIGDYILIFVPWFWQDEYERTPDPDFQLDDDEKAYVEAYFKEPFPYCDAPPTDAQIYRKMAWRRAKQIELATANNLESGRAEFKRIYPSHAVEAFQATGAGLFRADAILAARKNFNLVETEGALIAGVDPAGSSERSDRTVISIRRSRRILERIIYPQMRPMELAGICAQLINNKGLDMMFIDRGYGEGTIDRLLELGYGRRVCGVAFNERPLEPDIYSNKRSEIIIKYAEWINGGGVRIPDDDDGHADLASMPLDKKTSNGLRCLPPKEELKKALGGRSTDILDADALTFAYPVKSKEAQASEIGSVRRAPDREGSPRGRGLSGMSRFRRRLGRS